MSSLSSGYAQSEKLTCAHCDVQVEAELWLIFAEDERPDLIARCCDGTIHAIVCPACGDTFEALAPLLIYRPSLDDPLLYSPPHGMALKDFMSIAGELAGMLHHLLGDTWRDEWAHRAHVVARDKLAQALSLSGGVHDADGQPAPEPFASALRKADLAVQRFKQQGDRAAIALAIQTLETLLNDAVTLTQASEGLQITLYGEAGAARWSRYSDSANLDDLNQGIAHIERALALCIQRPDARAKYLANLGVALHDRYNATGDGADLGKALLMLRESVESTQDGYPLKPLHLSGYGNALRFEYARTGNIAVHQQAVEALQRAIDLSPPDDDNLPGWLNNLAAAQYERYTLTSVLADLDAALAACRRALSLEPKEIADRVIIMSSLAYGLHQRFDNTGDIAELNQAIALLTEALDLSPSTAIYAATLWNNLGNNYRQRYLHTSNLDDLSHAANCFEKAVACSTLSKDKAMLLNNLAHVRADRYRITSDLAWLSAAIQAEQEALSLVSPNAPNWPSYACSLCDSLVHRFQHLGALSDLEEAIHLGQRAMQATAEDSTEHAPVANSLAGALVERYICQGNLTDLEESVEMYRHATECASDHSPDQAMYQNNYAIGLHQLYRHRGGRDLLDRAVQVLEKGLDETDSASRMHVPLLSNYGTVLTARFHETNDREDIVNAINSHRHALSLSSPKQHAYTTLLSNLGGALVDQFGQSNDAGSLTEAIAIYQESLHIAQADTTTHARIANNLAMTFEMVQRTQPSDENLRRTIEAWRAACLEGQTLFWPGAVASGMAWGESALRREAWQEADEAFGYAMQAADSLFRSQLLRINREAWLSRAQGLGAQAAYVAAKLGQMERAAGIVERFQARLLALALEQQAMQLQLLQRDAPDLFERYQRAARQIALHENESLGQSGAMQEQMGDLRDAYTDLRSVMQDVQVRYPALSVTSASPAAIASQLQPDQALVYILTTDIGSLALAIRAGRTEVEAIWINIFTSRVLKTLLRNPDDDKSRRGRWINQLNNSEERDLLQTALEVVGNMLMRPIIQNLDGVTSVILVPNGQLSLFPLHAAPCDEAGIGNMSFDDCVLDHCAVTYSPIAGLISQSAKSGYRNDSRHLLVIGNPLSHPSPLAYATAEAEALGLLYRARRNILLCEQAATQQAVLLALPEAGIAHFACHGVFDAIQPLESRLELSNGDRLTLRDALMLDCFRGIRLVTLSACQTAVIESERLPDELTGLPSGLLQAGAKSVIATLWPVYDLSTMLLMSQLYQHLQDAESSPARALQYAQRWLRDATNAEIAEWFNQLYALTMTAPDGAHLAALSRQQRRVFALREPGVRPFEPAYYWAAFVCYGV